jgi:hypothetical protein
MLDQNFHKQLGASMAEGRRFQGALNTMLCRSAGNVEVVPGQGGGCRWAAGVVGFDDPYGLRGAGARRAHRRMGRRSSSW